MSCQFHNPASLCVGKDPDINQTEHRVGPVAGEEGHLVLLMDIEPET